MRIPTVLRAQVSEFAAPRARFPVHDILMEFQRAGDFSPRNTPQLPAIPLDNLLKFIEKPREFIEFYRNLRKFLRLQTSRLSSRNTGHTRGSSNANAGKCALPAILV